MANIVLKNNSHITAIEGRFGTSNRSQNYLLKYSNGKEYSIDFRKHSNGKWYIVVYRNTHVWSREFANFQCELCEHSDMSVISYPSLRDAKKDLDNQIYNIEIAIGLLREYQSADERFANLED